MKKSIKQLKKKADAEFSKYIRYRDGYKDTDGVWRGGCITCGVVKPLTQQQNGHFVSRGANVLRYDEENCNLQCVACNMFKQGEQFEYSKQIELKYGDGTAEKLHNQRHDRHKLTIDELEDIIKTSKEEVAKFIENA